MMMDAQLVRQGRPDDIEQVAGIRVRNRRDSYASLVPPEVLAEFVDRDRALAELRESTARPDAIFLVAEEAGGSVTGFALAYLEQGPDPWLESLHVSSTHRGQGVGTALMQALGQMLQTKGYGTLSLGVIKGNAGAGRLYRRLGATLVRIEPTEWAAGVDHEVYRWAGLAPLTRGIYNRAR
jgi:ribosomal protein S18 acetylase RimI-like enzyme